MTKTYQDMMSYLTIVNQRTIKSILKEGKLPKPNAQLLKAKEYLVELNALGSSINDHVSESVRTKWIKSHGDLRALTQEFTLIHFNNNKLPVPTGYVKINLKLPSSDQKLIGVLEVPTPDNPKLSMVKGANVGQLLDTLIRLVDELYELIIIIRENQYEPDDKIPLIVYAIFQFNQHRRKNLHQAMGGDTYNAFVTKLSIVYIELFGAPQ